MQSSVGFCVSVNLREVTGADFPLSFPIFLVVVFFIYNIADVHLLFTNTNLILPP